MATPRALGLILILVVCSLGFGCGDSAPAVPDTPDGAVKAVVEGLSNNQPEVVWAAMPASYRKDLNDVVHQFANKMDAELYDKGFGIAKKIVALLRDKKDLILEHPMVSMMAGVDVEKAKKNWNQVIDFADTIVASEISNLGKLKSLDVGDFLGGTVAKLMTQMQALSRLQEEDAYNKEFRDKLKGTKAEVVSMAGDTAELKITAPGEKPHSEKWIKVEGKWIPELMAKDWKKMMAEAREGIAKIDKDKIAEDKQEYLMMLAQIEQTVDKLAAAKDKKSFNDAVGEMMRGMLGNLMSDMPGGMPGGEPGEMKIPK